MTSFITPELTNVRDLELAIVSAGREIADGISKDYTDVQKTWNNTSDPITTTANPYKWRIEVKGKIFRYVDHGTRRRKIKAKRGKTLAFRAGYKRKSRKGSLTASSGGPFGDTVFAKEINHPGTDAREFTETIRAKWFDGKRAVAIADRELREVIK